MTKQHERPKSQTSLEEAPEPQKVPTTQVKVGETWQHVTYVIDLAEARGRHGRNSAVVTLRTFSRLRCVTGIREHSKVVRKMSSHKRQRIPGGS